MTKEEGLEFLRNHQPMPDEENVDAETIDKWNDVRVFFEENPCEEAIPLFLNSLGKGFGFGTYQLLDTFIGSFEPNIVIPYINEALVSSSIDIRRWAAEFSDSVRSGRHDLIKALLNLLSDSDESVRSSAILALLFKAMDKLYNWRVYEEMLRKGYNQETDLWIKSKYKDLFMLE